MKQFILARHGAERIDAMQTPPPRRAARGVGGGKTDDCGGCGAGVVRVRCGCGAGCGWRKNRWLWRKRPGRDKSRPYRSAHHRMIEINYALIGYVYGWGGKRGTTNASQPVGWANRVGNKLPALPLRGAARRGAGVAAKPMIAADAARVRWFKFAARVRAALGRSVRVFCVPCLASGRVRLGWWGGSARFRAGWCRGR